MENSARWLTDKFICLMLLALPLWPGLEGYSDITGAKFRLFAALTLVWLAALGVCAVKYRWRPARPRRFRRLGVAFMAAVCLSTLCSGRIGYCLLGSARRDGAVTLLLYGAIALGVSRWGEMPGALCKPHGPRGGALLRRGPLAAVPRERPRALSRGAELLRRGDAVHGRIPGHDGEHEPARGLVLPRHPAADRLGAPARALRCAGRCSCCPPRSVWRCSLP